MREGSYCSTDGAVLRYTERGKGPVVILIHGIFETRYRFALTAGILSARTGTRVVTMELRGHGCSKAKSGYNTRQYAEDIEALLDHLGAESAVLCGYSLGAFMAMNYLAYFGFSRVRALALLDWSPKIINGEDWQLGLMRGAYTKAEHRRDLKRIHRHFLLFRAGFIYRSMTRPRKNWYRGFPAIWAFVFAPFVMFSTRSNRAHIRAIWDAFNEGDYLSLLGQIKVPTLLACAVPGSFFLPEAADYMKAQIGENARVVRLGENSLLGYTHHTVPRRPGKLAGVLAEFINSL